MGHAPERGPREPSGRSQEAAGDSRSQMNDRRGARATTEPGLQADSRFFFSTFSLSAFRHPGRLRSNLKCYFRSSSHPSVYNLKHLFLHCRNGCCAASKNLFSACSTDT